MNKRDLHVQLERRFCLYFFPVLLLFLLLSYLHRQGLSPVPPFGSLRIWGLLLFLSTVLLSVAAPIILRAFFQSFVAREGGAALITFYRLQLRMSLLSLLGSYTALLAYLFLVPPFYLYASVLMALYGIYAVLPSRKKLQRELHIYGVRDAV